MIQSLRMAKLMNLMNAFREGASDSRLSQDEERMLAFVYEREHKEISTTVSDIVVSHLFGTPPTVQRKVNHLTKSGMLVMTKDKSDLRKQRLLLSDTAVRYFEDLAKHLSTAFE